MNKLKRKMTESSSDSDDDSGSSSPTNISPTIENYPKETFELISLLYSKAKGLTV